MNCSKCSTLLTKKSRGTANSLVTPVVPFAGEIDPLRMPKLVAHKVEPRLTPKHGSDCPDHLCILR